MRRGLLAAAFAALTCLALSATGCAATATPGARGGTGGTGAPGTAASGTATSGTASADASYASATGSPQQQASAAATAILRAFVPPPGAARQAAEPARARHSLDSAGGYESAYEVQKTSWWLVPGQAAALIAWETAHLPRAFTPSSSDGGGNPATIAVTGQFYTLPPRGALVGQYLIVSVADLGGGETAIRVDAQVGYRPARPAGEKVPATARAVTISELYGSPGATPAPATITRGAVVGKLAALLNGLPLSTAPMPSPCPSGWGPVLELTFRSAAAGRALAVAQGPGGCATLSLTVAGKQWPLLGLTSSFSTEVLQIAGLRWPVRSTLPGGPQTP